MKTIALTALLAFFSSSARAEPCAEAHTLLEGQPSPCDGDLLPVSVVERLLNNTTALELAKKRLAELEAKCSDEIEACEINLKTERELRKAAEAAQVPLPQRDERSWSSEPWFVATVSVVATALVILGAQHLAKP